MIERYTRPEMGKIWGERAKFDRWLKVELLALQGMAIAGTVPQAVCDEVVEKARVRPERAAELENEVKHDVIAFLSSITEEVGPAARYLHRGMTSSDLLDTALAVALRESGELIVDGIVALQESLKRRAFEFQITPCIGRSHGIHAEPTTFGLKLASFYAELGRRREHLVSAIESISVGKIAGAVGTYASVSPQVEEYVLGGLALVPEAVPSQIVHRDRHAEFFVSLALLGSSLERIVVEIRHLQRTEVGEVEEGFAKGQKGSSAMPHKKNPIGSENITGLARLLRSYAQAALENVALWHERDISHSSVERVIAPDACILADYAVARLQNLIDNLVVYPERMEANLNMTRGLVFSGTLLIRLADAGMTREEAYSVVQGHALASWKGGSSFIDRVREDLRISRHLSGEDLDEIFSINRHLQFVPTIFERVFGAAL